MAASLVELTDVASVDRAARALFGSPLDTRPAVSHSFAAWRAAPDAPLTTIRINEHGPKSDLDFLALHIARARADGIIITGKILRDEPNLTYSLEADPRWGDALKQWRQRRWGLCDPPWLLVLTGRGDIGRVRPEPGPRRRKGGFEMRTTVKIFALALAVMIVRGALAVF